MSKTEKDATRANELERQIEKCALEFTGYSRDELYESFKAGSVNQHHIAFEAGKKAGRSEAIDYLREKLIAYQHMRDGWKEGSPSFEAYDLMCRELSRYSKELEKLRTTTI